MDCPRCGASLAEYEYRGMEAVGCEACGYLGVAVEHTSDYREVESWEEALRRFRERTA